MKGIIYSILFALVQCCLTQAKPSTLRAVVRKQGDEFSVDVSRWELGEDGVAWAEFENTLNVTGWGILDIETNSKFDDEDQAYAAGMLEGYLTAEHIHTTADNLVQVIFKAKKMPKEVKAFLDKQEDWARSQVDANKATDPFFAQLGFVLRQYDGLMDGFVMRTPEVPFLGSWAFQMLNAVGDLFDIIPTVQEEKRKDWLELNRTEAEWLHAVQGHCSALIKLTGDYSDLFVGHSSWYTFSNTNRIMKHYNLNFNHPSTAAKRVSFSSYPGFLESLDDFYMLSSGLTWTQTSLPVLDHKNYELVKPESLLAWQRVRVASAMAHSGPEWFQHFRRHYSGTYANQYMIVDMNLFRPREELKNNTLWVVEEIPGMIIGEDQTEVLSLGYWPSYNVPFYRNIFVRSGYEAMRRKHGGSFWTYELNPRGEIFRRDQGSVVDLETFKQILRSNKYLVDPYSFDGEGQNPMYAICSRGDLGRVKQGATGCYDTKVTSYIYGATRQHAQIINGPTAHFSGESLKPFSWTGEFANSPHAGLPLVYNFSFVETQPKALKGHPHHFAQLVPQSLEIE